MVIYDLICDSGHQFEGWFKNSEELNSQKEQGILTCPYCSSSAVTKKVTASKVGKKSNSFDSSSAVPEPVATSIKQQAAPEYAQLQKMLGKVHDYVENNFVDVGNNFTDEALSIHRGEKEPSNIRGTASKKQLKELSEEGVSALPLPPKPVSKKDLN